MSFKMIIANIMVIFMFLLSMSCCANPGTVEDNIITTKVKIELQKEPDLPVNDIRVITENGIVKLEGRLETGLQVNRAVEIASSINDVVNVDADRLKVKNSHTLMTDMLITAKAKGRILNLYLNERIAGGYDLHVETTNQKVHIYGVVAAEKDIQAIKEAVSNIVGVKQVNTNIKLK